jgi:putative oxidoreductase
LASVEASCNHVLADRGGGKEVLMGLFGYRDVLDARASVGMLALRLVAGSAFVLHGSSKIVNPFGWMGPEAPVPGFLQALAAISEFGGGLAWIAGLLVPLASLGLVCTMATAASTHIQRGDPFVGVPASWELAAVYLAVAVLLLCAGPGIFSLDRLLFRRKA